jgi:hypothetical protein
MEREELEKIIEQASLDLTSLNISRKDIDTLPDSIVNLGHTLIYLDISHNCLLTGHIHILRVPPEMTSAEAAITWVNHGIHPDEFARQT